MGDWADRFAVEATWQGRSSDVDDLLFGPYQSERNARLWLVNIGALLADLHGPGQWSVRLRTLHAGRPTRRTIEELA